MILTERDRIRRVSDAWDAQYEKYKDDAKWQDKFRIGDILRSLDPETVSAHTIATIIGNSSWTDIRCNACQEKVLSVVMFEAGEDGEFNLCLACLGKANAALQVIEPDAREGR